jgi:hypothetical protein
VEYEPEGAQKDELILPYSAFGTAGT